MSEIEKKKKLAAAICEFLETSLKDGTIKSEDTDGIEVAVQCIGEAFGVDMSDDAVRSKYSIKPLGLPAIFDVFLNTQQKKQQDGSKEDEESRMKSAEEKKAAGNKAVAAKEYPEAIRLYTEAIELDATNAIFFSNRAAAYSQMGEHDKAIEDANAALKLDETYSKAYSRLGHALFCTGKYDEAIRAYTKGLDLEPGNASMQNSLAAAKQKVAETSDVKAPNATASNPLAGLAGLGGLGGLGGAGGPGGMDFASMMNNPEFMKMASSMMSNPQFSEMMNKPEVAQMAQNLMKDPSALNSLLGNLGGPKK